jgi:hypothetical protein
LRQEGVAAMKPTIKHSARLEHEWGNNDPLTVHEVQTFLNHLPPQGKIVPIIRDVGSQRDPDRRMIGMNVVWED